MHDPYTQKDILAIESVQRRCAKFVYNNYSSHTSVTGMLQNLNWPPLAHCRNQLKVITMLSRVCCKVQTVVFRYFKFSFTALKLAYNYFVA